MHRPMMILAGERQLGQRASPNCEQIVALGVAPCAGLERQLSTVAKRDFRGRAVGR
jgi:hypothetical protein